MILTALILFALAAVGGLYLATRHLSAQAPSIGVAVVHGLLAAGGLVVLIITLLGATRVGGLQWTALALFVVAALGGFVLFAQHLREKTLPSGLIYVHGGAAVIAFILLLITYL